MTPTSWLILYLLAIHLLAALLTAADKRRAQTGRWRVPEATLWGVAVLGGAAAMWLTMRLVHHKTRRFGFMFGLPALALLQALLLWFSGIFAG